VRERAVQRGRHVHAAARTRVEKAEDKEDASVAHTGRDGRWWRTDRSLDKMRGEGRDAKAAVRCSLSCAGFGDWRCQAAEQEHYDQGGDGCQRRL
jgi:hypothetical protein